MILLVPSGTISCHSTVRVFDKCPLTISALIFANTSTNGLFATMQWNYGM